ncbi:2'-5' RNA ligase family protein [Echinicola vietnamensis]|uniref:2'-5' RNA ligase n=1 Tax=Echinicola vietnamensis (strain DSM 17526 / LMG 23754 / KMM 6221) TaxID=926556 RepID=L0G5U2_ECHVK|nr:2'-5' RNA ligase family protein [Echinicola vietnamensis]AGA80210.1 hypothetical protein Echvi_4003 [Echinicola vietnamensis DSM 17526]
MDLQAHYHSLFTKARQELIIKGNEVDKKINDPSDSRRGITLLARPDDRCKSHIVDFLETLHQIDPYQYFYPSTDLHITVMSIISCYPEFKLEHINIDDYAAIIRESLSQIPPFEIHFKGVTLSKAGVLLQGYPSTDALERLRDSLRQHFKSSTLQQSLDKRYAIQTAHSTIMRYPQPLKNISDFIQVLEKNRATHFGTFTINNLELVYNDWYQRQENVKVLQQFPLRTNP